MTRTSYIPNHRPFHIALSALLLLHPQNALAEIEGRFSLPPSNAPSGFVQTIQDHFVLPNPYAQGSPYYNLDMEKRYQIHVLPFLEADVEKAKSNSAIAATSDCQAVSIGEEGCITFHSSWEGSDFNAIKVVTRTGRLWLTITVTGRAEYARGNDSHAVMTKPVPSDAEVLQVAKQFLGATAGYVTDQGLDLHETRDVGGKRTREDPEVSEENVLQLPDSFNVTVDGFPVEAPGVETTNTPLVFRFREERFTGKQTTKMTANHGGRRGPWQRDEVTLYEGVFEDGFARGDYEYCSSGMWPVHGGPYDRFCHYGDISGEADEEGKLHLTIDVNRFKLMTRDILTDSNSNEYLGPWADVTGDPSYGRVPHTLELTIPLPIGQQESSTGLDELDEPVVDVVVARTPPETSDSGNSPFSVTTRTGTKNGEETPWIEQEDPSSDDPIASAGETAAAGVAAGATALLGSLLMIGGSGVSWTDIVDGAREMLGMTSTEPLPDPPPGPIDERQSDAAYREQVRLIQEDLERNRDLLDRERARLAANEAEGNGAHLAGIRDRIKEHERLVALDREQLDRLGEAEPEHTTESNDDVAQDAAESARNRELLQEIQESEERIQARREEMERRGAEIQAEEQEVAREWERLELESQFMNDVEKVLEEGYRVANPGCDQNFLMREVTDLGVFVGNLSQIPKAFVPNLEPQRCEDFAKKGVERLEKIVRSMYGDQADKVVVDRVFVDVVRGDDWAGTAAKVLDIVAPRNHIANRVILPDGRRYILDYWDAARGGGIRMVSEEQWVQTWKERYGEDCQFFGSYEYGPLEKDMVERVDALQREQTLSRDEALDIFRTEQRERIGNARVPDADKEIAVQRLDTQITSFKRYGKFRDPGATTDE